MTKVDFLLHDGLITGFTITDHAEYGEEGSDILGRSTENEGERETGESGETVSADEWYKDIALNCFRYLGMKSFKEVNQLTVPEYNLLMKAATLKEVDKDYRNHLQAFLNVKAQAKKKAGKNKTKPVYNTFRKFYNYENAIKRVLGISKESKFSSLSKYIAGKEKDG